MRTVIRFTTAMLLTLGAIGVARAGGTETALFSFKGNRSDGKAPNGPLTLVGGVFYGTTSLGGGSGKGTVFSIIFNGTETVLHSFGSSGDGSRPYAPLVAGQFSKSRLKVSLPF